jgi:HAD superfamily hydrolase (TIGR01549 family)
LAQFDPISDVIELFNSILNKKKIAVVTNNLHSTAERVLRSLGLLNSNVCIVGFNDVKCSKPDPEGILIALQKLNVNKSQAIMIGDSEVDSKAANYAPITFYHVNKLLYMNRKLYEYFGK